MHLNFSAEPGVSRPLRNGLLLATLTIALIIQIPMMFNVHTVEYDEAIFLDVARNIRYTGLPLRSIGAQGAFYFEHTFLYVYLLSLCIATSPAGVFMTRLLTLVFSLGCIWLTFVCGELLRGPKAGFIAALLLALNPFFAVYSFFVYMEIPMTFAILTAFRCFLYYLKTKRVQWIILTGITIAIAVLFKEIALLFAGVLMLYFLTTPPFQKRQMLKNILLISMPPALGIIGWGMWCFSMSPTTFIGNLNRWLDSAAIGKSTDFRMSITFNQWTYKIIFELLGIPLALGLLMALGVIILKKYKPSDAATLLARYIVIAIGFSYIIKLKELRHLIAIIPAAALLVGVSINWEKTLAHEQRIIRKIKRLILIAFLLIGGVSPLRLPLQSPASLRDWLAPLYAARLLDNESYYNVLRLAGLYLRDHTPATTIIVVVHEGPVIGYYADRHYKFLYTKNSMNAIIELLEETQILVWDHTVFPALEAEQIQTIQEYVQRNFTVEQIINDNHRQLIIYQQPRAAPEN